MNVFRFISRLPQPLRSFYILFIVVFIIGMVPVLLQVPNASVWMSMGIGVASALLGLCLVINLNKAADGLARAVAREKIMGVDYSTSIMAKPAFARFFGFMFVVGGTLSIIRAVTAA